MAPRTLPHFAQESENGPGRRKESMWYRGAAPLRPLGQWGTLVPGPKAQERAGWPRLAFPQGAPYHFQRLRQERGKGEGQESRTEKTQLMAKCLLEGGALPPYPPTPHPLSAG